MKAYETPQTLTFSEALRNATSIPWPSLSAIRGVFGPSTCESKVRALSVREGEGGREDMPKLVCGTSFPRC
eukprot:493195-Amorphochlora_amoeboformis.AAC.2